MPEFSLFCETYTVRVPATGRVLAGAVCAAGSSRERRNGLLAKTRLEEGAGLWIAPCEAIHTFGMRFAIDAVFIDKKWRVCRIAEHLGPRRIAVSLRAYSVLEIAAGAARRAGLSVGAGLEFALNPQSEEEAAA